MTGRYLHREMIILMEMIRSSNLTDYIGNNKIDLENFEKIVIHNDAI